MNIINSEKWKQVTYRIEELAKEKGHTVLQLPACHFELILLELRLAQVKHHTGNSKDIKTNGMEKLTW
jgi:hypothetical protein